MRAGPKSSLSLKTYLFLKGNQEMQIKLKGVSGPLSVNYLGHRLTLLNVSRTNADPHRWPQTCPDVASGIKDRPFMKASEDSLL